MKKLQDFSGLSNKKILLIDDEREILDLLETVLSREGFKEIYKARTGREGIRLCQEVNPDIIVLDIMLPDIDGYEVCRRLREISFVPIIFLSAKTDNIDKLLGLGIGGDDYVTKPFSPKEVAYRIKARFRRKEYLGSTGSTKNKIEIGDIKIDKKKVEVTKNNNPLELTAMEYKLLLYFAENPGQILSKKRIYQQVWQDEFLGNDNVIMVHIRHLRKKIEDDPGNPRYIKTVKGLGYKMVTESE